MTEEGDQRQSNPGSYGSGPTVEGRTQPSELFSNMRAKLIAAGFTAVAESPEVFASWGMIRLPVDPLTLFGERKAFLSRRLALLEQAGQLEQVRFVDQVPGFSEVVSAIAGSSGFENEGLLNQGIEEVLAEQTTTELGDFIAWCERTYYYTYVSVNEWLVGAIVGVCVGRDNPKNPQRDEYAKDPRAFFDADPINTSYYPHALGFQHWLYQLAMLVLQKSEEAITMVEVQNHVDRLLLEYYLLPAKELNARGVNNTGLNQFLAEILADDLAEGDRIVITLKVLRELGVIMQGATMIEELLIAYAFENAPIHFPSDNPEILAATVSTTTGEVVVRLNESLYAVYMSEVHEEAHKFGLSVDPDAIGSDSLKDGVARRTVPRLAPPRMVRSY